ncbi:hypothetical protein MPSEU_000790300 [Mayamaea pseudoterrestris]|nr:hypothetical protein MPSEU_000790300 [Mayamaea pseudoterrestris]
MVQALLFLPLALLLVSASCIRQYRGIDVLKKNRKHKKLLHLRHHVTAVTTTSSSRHSYSSETVQELYLTQRLDHFSPVDARTFQQRYFYSNVFAEKVHNGTSTKPTLALLCVGGEGPPLDESVLVDSVHCSGDMLEFAKIVNEEYSIHLYALEHRYYGESFPEFAWNESPVTNENLVYLSSKQAVQDIGHFITTRNTKLPKSTIWIAFGGSYPGMLAAWSRLKLPHLISMAVSNSAPVQVVLDFVAYNAHVAKEWANPQVGGSEQCLRIMQQGYVELEVAIDAASTNQTLRQDIASAFHLCDSEALLNRKNLQLLLGDDLYPFSVQENDPSCEKDLCNIRKVCRALVDQVQSKNATNSTTKNMDALSWMVQQHGHVDSCIDISYDNLIELYADADGEYSLDIRPWLWQTCAEVGFYQTCERNASCPFGQGWHPLSQDLEMCQAAFGISPHQVAQNVQSTLEYYSGWNMQATNILSVTGAVDPWSEQALQKSRSSIDLPVYSVPKASHHFWTHPVNATDGKEVNLARSIIFSTLKKWIDEVLIKQTENGNFKVMNDAAAEM